MKASIYATMMDFFSAGLPVLESKEAVQAPEDRLNEVSDNLSHNNDNNKKK